MKKKYLLNYILTRNNKNAKLYKRVLKKSIEARGAKNAS